MDLCLGTLVPKCYRTPTNIHQWQSYFNKKKYMELALEACIASSFMCTKKVSSTVYSITISGDTIIHFSVPKIIFTPTKALGTGDVLFHIHAHTMLLSSPEALDDVLKWCFYVYNHIVMLVALDECYDIDAKNALHTYYTDIRIWYHYRYSIAQLMLCIVMAYKVSTALLTHCLQLHYDIYAPIKYVKAYNILYDLLYQQTAKVAYRTRAQELQIPSPAPCTLYCAVDTKNPRECIQVQSIMIAYSHLRTCCVGYTCPSTIAKRQKHIPILLWKTTTIASCTQSLPEDIDVASTRYPFIDNLITNNITTDMVIVCMPTPVPKDAITLLLEHGVTKIVFQLHTIHAALHLASQWTTFTRLPSTVTLHKMFPIDSVTTAPGMDDTALFTSLQTTLAQKAPANIEWIRPAGTPMPAQPLPEYTQDILRDIATRIHQDIPVMIAIRTPVQDIDISSFLAQCSTINNVHFVHVLSAPVTHAMLYNLFQRHPYQNGVLWVDHHITDDSEFFALIDFIMEFCGSSNIVGRLGAWVFVTRTVLSDPDMWTLFQESYPHCPLIDLDESN